MQIYRIDILKLILANESNLYLFVLISDAEVKNEVQDCPESDSVPGELYIDENAEEKEQEYPDSLEKTDYGSLYGANQYYNRYINVNPAIIKAQHCVWLSIDS